MNHTIELRLNSLGFNSDDVGEALPDFMADRDTLVGLTWYPCAEGPQSFLLVVTIYAGVAAVAKVFLEELSKDLYKWAKEKIGSLLRKKPNFVGNIMVKFDDCEIEITIDKDIQKLEATLKSLAEIISAELNKEKSE